jgi:hypothetical protein
MRKAPVWLAPFATALVVALAERVYFSFDGLYGQDAFAYFRYARALWPHLAHGAPLPKLYWPIGYPVTVAVLLPLTAGGPGAGQLVSALACAWTAAATALLVRDLAIPHPRLAPLSGEHAEPRRMAPLSGEHAEPRQDSPADRWPPLVAGVTVAVSGAVIRYSQVVMADALGMAAAAAALVCIVRYAEHRRGPWLVACAVFLAWGAAARWMVGLLALPVGTFLLLDAWIARGAPASTSIRKPWPWAWGVSAALAGLAILGPVLVVAQGSPPSFAKHAWLVQWSLRNAFGREFDTPDGHAVYRLPVVVSYLVRLAWPDYFFPVHALFVLTGAWILVRRRRWTACALLLGWPATALLFLSGIPYQNPRFLVPTLPAIGALFGVGLSFLMRPDGRPDWMRHAGLRVAMGIVIVAAQVLGMAYGLREHARLVARNDVDRDLVAWTVGRLPPGATLVMNGPSLAFEYYGSISAPDLFSASDADIEALRASPSPVFVLADVDNLESQWSGLNPERHFAALRQRPGLRVVGVHPPYTLFRLAAAGD